MKPKFDARSSKKQMTYSEQSLENQRSIDFKNGIIRRNNTNERSAESNNSFQMMDIHEGYNYSKSSMKSEVFGLQKFESGNKT